MSICARGIKVCCRSARVLSQSAQGRLQSPLQRATLRGLAYRTVSLGSVLNSSYRCVLSLPLHWTLNPLSHLIAFLARDILPHGQVLLIAKVAFVSPTERP